MLSLELRGLNVPNLVFALILKGLSKGLSKRMATLLPFVLLRVLAMNKPRERTRLFGLINPSMALARFPLMLTSRVTSDCSLIVKSVGMINV